MVSFWSGICQCLEQGEEVVVATVVQHAGSTPRTSGSKMFVRSDGRASGTIGGGALEGDVIRSSLNLFATRGAALKFYDFSDSAGTRDLDLICGGQMRVLMEHLSAEARNLELYGALSDAAGSSIPVLCVGRLEGDDTDLVVERSVITAGGETIGSAPMSPDLVQELGAHAARHPSASLLTLGDQRYVVEAILPQLTVYLVGAGHVSMEIAWLAERAGFRTVVMDDRTEFATRERFPSADTVLVCPDFRQVFDGFDIGAESCIVIVTRGHRFDKEVLAQALESRAGYIGMIGSVRKRDTIYRALVDEGVDPGDLERVYCPVGLPIDAETPAEIAVSIAAQLIAHRARLRGHA